MRKNAIIIGVVAGILCIIMMVVIYAAVSFYTKPPAPTLSLATATILEPADTPISQIATQTTAPIENPTPVPQICGQTGTWTILVLGRTIHKDPAPAQTIRLVKVDFDQKRAVIYSLPPDLVLETPGLVAEYKIQTSRLQDIFTALVISGGKNRDTDYKATQATAQAILDNFGIVAEHYITIKEDFVSETVDTIGGIDVVLPQDFTMPQYSKYKGLLLKAGKQHFDSEMVHAYTTYRYDASDEFSRLAHQNVVLEGMRTKLLDPAVYVKIPDLYTIYKNNIVTDLSLEQIAALSCLTRLIPAENIIVETPNIGQIVVKQDGSMYMKDPASLVKRIQTLFGVP